MTTKSPFSLTSRAFTFVSGTLSLLVAITPYRGEAQNFTSAATDRVSIGQHSGASQTTLASTNPRTSRNGRFVVFESVAGNLLRPTGSPSLTAGRKHCYLLDRQAGSVELVSMRRNGTEAQFDCSNPVVSADGRYVSYSSSFITATEVGQMVSVGARYNFYHLNQATDGAHIFIRDRLANVNFVGDQVTLSANVVALNAGVPQVTDSGLKVQLPDLCDSDADGNVTEVLPLPLVAPALEEIPQRQSGVVVGTSTDPSGANPFLSAEGQFLVFDTLANNLGGAEPSAILEVPTPCVDYDRVDCIGGRHTATCADDGYLYDSGHLTWVGFPLPGFYFDDNNRRDIYVRDGVEFSTKLMSLGCKFHAPNGCGIKGNQDSINPSISDDGKLISFHSASTNLLDVDFNAVSDVYIVERNDFNGEVAKLGRVSNATNRITAGDGVSVDGSISGDGRYIAFSSSATNLVDNDTNGASDVFIYDRSFFNTTRCVSANGQGNGASSGVEITGSGEYIVLQSVSTNFGATAVTSNIYSGKITKDSKGKIIGCVLELASSGASGSGGNLNSSNASAAILPVTVGSGATAKRQLRPGVVYQSLATNLNRGLADTNNVSDIFQAPVCGTTDANTDSDNDGTTDCFDQCWKDDTKVVDADLDGDGIADCEDGCPSDSQKTVAGSCGCGKADIDTDLDLKPDCVDECPNDPKKTAVGQCGCGFPDTDSDGDKIPDCKESTIPTTPTPGGPNPGVTPTATPVGGTTGFTQFTPSKPRITKVGSDAVIVELPLDRVGKKIAEFQVTLVERVGKEAIEKKLTRKRKSFRLSTLAPGRYRLYFNLLSVDNELSNRSPSSAMFTIGG